jgi:hypothetical protein
VDCRAQQKKRMLQEDEDEDPGEESEEEEVDENPSGGGKAFLGLLLYEDYVNKCWIQTFQNEKRSLQPSMISTAEKRKSSSGTKMRGKYTKGYVGHCDFGVLRERGWQQFNERVV